MPASQTKTDFVFDHIIERSRPSARGERSGTTVAMIILLAITVAAALFVHPSPSLATLQEAGPQIAQAS